MDKKNWLCFRDVESGEQGGVRPLYLILYPICQSNWLESIHYRLFCFRRIRSFINYAQEHLGKSEEQSVIIFWLDWRKNELFLQSSTWKKKSKSIVKVKSRFFKNRELYWYWSNLSQNSNCGRELVKNPGFKSPLGKVKFFCPIFFSFSHSP